MGTPVSGAIGMGVACTSGIESMAWSQFNSDLTEHRGTCSELQVRENIFPAFLSP
jgi:hypothetical protein